MNTEIVKLETPELLAIDTSKAKQIKQTFEPMVKLLETFEEIYNEIVTESKSGITKELCAKAKRTRLDIGKVRISTDKARLSGNEESQREIKARNGVAHLVTWAVSDKETKLKEIENHFEILEQERLENLQTERAEQLSKYVEDAHQRRLSDMDEDVWNAYLSTKKKEHEDRIEAEKQAELKRIENERIDKLHKERYEKLLPYWDFVPVGFKSLNMGMAIEMEFNSVLEDVKKAKIEHDKAIENQRLENERLKKEAEAKEKELEKERLKAKAEADKLKAENEAKLKKEQEAKAKLEAELKAKKDAEIKSENERKAAELKAKAEAEKLAKAPVKNQLNAWVDDFELPVTNVEHYKKAIIEEKFSAFKKWAKNEIESI